MSVWDDPSLKVGGDFVRFDNIGDTVSGTIGVVRAHRFEDGSVAPQILLTTDDGEEKTITAGQVRLKTELATQRPEAGDHITITLSDVEKRSGGKTLKHFTVDVRRGGNPAPAAATTAPSPAADAPAATGASGEAQAALAALTPEQRAALGIG